MFAEAVGIDLFPLPTVSSSTKSTPLNTHRRCKRTAAIIGEMLLRGGNLT